VRVSEKKNKDARSEKKIRKNCGTVEKRRRRNRWFFDP
jgi:hypothetical protein